jgi:hypothetical protein
MIYAWFKRVDIYVISALDVLIGWGWLTGSPHRTLSHSYDPAKALLFFSSSPMRYWGGLLLILSLFKLYCRVNERRALPVASLLLAAHWFWWFVVSIIFYVTGDGSLYGPCLVFGFAWRHFAYFFSATDKQG